MMGKPHLSTNSTGQLQSFGISGHLGLFAGSSQPSVSSTGSETPQTPSLQDQLKGHPEGNTQQWKETQIFPRKCM